jgi:alanyl-tRNA synthetase
MKTTRLYQENVYLQECTATVLAATNKKIVLDRTVFFPVGGGQSCDLGTISGKAVEEVVETGKIIYHIMEEDVDFLPGDKVSCNIDWSRRFDHMQRHCGEHILSGILYREYGGINRGFHMGENYMTVDISLEENPAIRELTWDMAIKAEQLTNAVICSNAPVTVIHFETRADAEKMPLRKKLAIDEAITIVSVGSIDEAGDCVACCGTHPSTAGQVGLLKILKIEKYKGMFRLYFEAGKRALFDYDHKHEIIKTLCDHYSASTADLLEKIQVREKKMDALKDELYHLKKFAINHRIDELRSEVTIDEVITVTDEEMKIDGLLSIGRALIPNIKKLLLVTAAAENTVLLFSGGTPDCGKLVKENASIYHGKGGGNPTCARAIFKNPDYASTFIDLLKKHLA